MTKWVETKIEKIDQLPLVDEVVLQAHDRDTGYKAVVDKTTMNTVCVIPDKYNLIQHKHVLEEVQKLKDYMPKKIKLMENGRRMMIEVTERTPQKIELLPEDYLECGARITNDYGRNVGLSVAGFATRLVCENGMTAPRVGRKMQVFAFGTSEFSKELEQQVEACLNTWTDDIITELFKRANETEVHVKDIINEHSFLPKKHMEEIIGKLKDKETLYNIYNAYTELIQHKIAPNTKEFNTIGLQKRANKILMVQVI